MIPILASALAFLLIAVAMVLAPLEQATVVDVQAGGAASDALALAGSAADEALLAFGRAANDPARETFRGARSAEGLLCAASWTPPVPGTPLSAALATGCTLDPVRLSVEVEARTTGVAPLEVRGRVVARATAHTRVGRRAIERNIERVQGFRLSRLGLPWPFTNIALFVHRPEGLLGDAPQLAARLAGDLASLEAALEPVLDAPALAVTARRLRSLRRFFDGPGHGVPWRRASFYLSPRTDRVEDLSRLTLAAAARRLATRRDELGDEPLARAKVSSASFGVDASVTALLDVAAELETELRTTLARWVKVHHESAPHRDELAPGIAAALTERKPLAWYELPSLQPFHELYPDRGAPGAISTTGTAELDLTGPLGERLVIASAGPVHVHDVASTRGLVTIVSDGPLKVSGTVQAHLVAKNGLTVAPGARLLGNVFVAGGPVELGEAASLAADARVRQRSESEPCPRLYHLALDPVRTTRTAR